MRIVRIFAFALLLISFCVDTTSAQTNRRKQRTESVTSKAGGAATPSSAKEQPKNTPGEFELFMTSLLKNAFVVVRQDYQLVDEDEGDVINAEGEKYWKRVYSLGARVGDSDFLISGDAVIPWSKESLSSRDRYQPMVSATAFRGFEATEFEPLDYSTDGVTELRSRRLYTTPGSEEPGLSLVGLSGRTAGYAVWAIPDEAVEAGQGKASFGLRFVPVSVAFTDGRSVYDFSPEGDEAAFGGFYLVPLKAHPGCVDFGVAGMFQRIGGVWKLVSVPDGTEIKSTAFAGAFTETFVSLAASVDSEMQAFVKEIGL